MEWYPFQGGLWAFLSISLCQFFYWFEDLRRTLFPGGRLQCFPSFQTLATDSGWGPPSLPSHTTAPLDGCDRRTCCQWEITLCPFVWRAKNKNNACFLWVTAFASKAERSTKELVRLGKHRSFILVLIQGKRLIGITLGQRETDSNNQMMLISELASTYIRYEK